MVKKIKTVKELRKHIGETVRVVTENDYTFDAVVEMESCVEDPYPVLYTTDKAAAKSTYWWGGFRGKYGHNCADDYQITKELKSLTLVKEKATKKTTKYLTKDELDAAQGHFCLLEDGSKGFICKKTAGYSMYPTRVLHNSSESRGWEYTDTERSEDNAPESIKYTFSKAWNANDEEDAVRIKVIEVLEKYDGRKYRFKKAKKEAPKADEESVKTIETPKTILDMTIREVLEKLDEIIKR